MKVNSNKRNQNYFLALWSVISPATRHSAGINHVNQSPHNWVKSILILIDQNQLVSSIYNKTFIFLFDIVWIS